MSGDAEKQMILGRTLREVRLRRKRHTRNRRLLGSVSMLAVAAAAGVLAGWVPGLGGGSRSTPHVPGAALLVPEATLSTTPDDEVVAWGTPQSLVLVVNADGIEVRALNESQFRALAQKPGCRFSLTPDALMWVSEVADDPVSSGLSAGF